VSVNVTPSVGNEGAEAISLPADDASCAQRPPSITVGGHVFECRPVVRGYADLRRRAENANRAALSSDPRIDRRRVQRLLRALLRAAVVDHARLDRLLRQCPELLEEALDEGIRLDTQVYDGSGRSR
jgi:hypothetical protein